MLPLLLASCSKDATAPAELTAPVPTTITPVSGTAQTGTAGQQLSQPLVVKAATAVGTGVGGVTVSWAVTAGGGSLSAATVTTDAQGNASVIWTLGTTAGSGNNTATASAGGLSGSPVAFTASANPGPPSQITVVSGNDQTGTVAQALPQPLVVLVRDQFNNPAGGTTVAWAVALGGGSLSASSSSTDAQGRATVTWTLGTVAGINNNSVQASVSGLPGSPATFTATANAGAATQLGYVSGNVQTGKVGMSLALPLVVLVRDQFDNPVSGVAVAWAVTAAGGALSAASTPTNGEGQASVTWTLGTTAGSSNNSAQASAPGLSGSPMVFTASAVPAAANQLSIVSGNNQSGSVGQALGQPLRVVVRDQFNNGVSGITVTWAVAGGDGSLSASTSTTDSEGQASLTWTLGTVTGTSNNTATASAAGLSGSPLTFAASANPGPATQLASVSGNAQTGTVGQLLGQPLVVVVKDQYDNGVGGVVVAWSVTGGGGGLSSASTTTNSEGLASVTWTLGTGAGLNNNTSQALTTLTGSPVTFTASADPGAPSQIALVSGNAQAATVGQALAQPVVVAVRDQYSNGVQGVTVAWAVTGGGGNLSAANTTSGTQGQTSVTWTLGTVAGTSNNTATASVSGLTGSPVALTASANAGPATQMALDGGHNQTAPAGTVLPIPLSVLVADGYGNGVAGVTVDWLVTSGGGSVSATSSQTGGTGLASVQRTLGPSAGTHTASATVSGLTGSVDFSATATPNATISGTITLSNSFLSAPLAASTSVAVVPDVTLARSTPMKSVENRDQVRNLATPVVMPPGRFTPDELIVTYRNTGLSVPAVGSAAMRSASTARAAGAAIRSDLSRVLSPTLAVVTGVSPAILAARVRVQDPARLDEVASALQRNPNVVSVERNALAYTDDLRERRAGPLETSTNDPLYPWQAWHYAMIDLPEGWDVTTGSSSVLVAVVDDGIRFDHPAIASNLTTDGYDFASSSIANHCAGGIVDLAGDGDGYDSNPTIPASYLYNSGLNCYTTFTGIGGHGLHVAGTIGAVGNDAVGVTGVNWTVRIRPVRVLNSGGTGTWYDVAQGILYAAGLPADNGSGGTVPAVTPARIINLSLGGPTNNTALQNAVTSASAAGVLLIAAAGNDGTSNPSYPAAYSDVLSVSAVGPDLVLASYSTYGSTVDIAAPGGDIGDGGSTFGVYSTQWNFGTNSHAYNSIQGTSMAAPHVTGVAALLLAQGPSLTAAQLRARLVDYAVDVGTPGRDDLYGAGVVNARNSLTQTLAPPRQLYARLYNATTGAMLSTLPVQPDGSYAFGALADANYHVFAGQDANSDAVVGLPGRRWSAFGTTSTPTTITVSGTGIYPASFSAGFPIETEANGTTGTADVLPVGGWMYGTISSASTDLDAYRVVIPLSGQYTFETSAWDGACGFALEEDTILGLYDSGGSPITSNDDINFGAHNYCSRITMTLAPGTYYVAVTGYYSATRYRLQARSGS